MCKSLLPALLLLLVVSAVAVTSEAATPDGNEAELLKRVSDQQDPIVRVRLSGALLFASWDGIRVNLDNFFDLLFHSNIGELIRKANGIFQRSEIKGSVKLHLPDGTLGPNVVTIFERSGYDRIAFAEPFYFSHEFEIPKSKLTSSEFVIECNLQEDEHGDVCKGEKSYQAHLTTYSGSFGNSETSDERDISDVIATFLNILGYEKLYRASGETTLKDVIKKAVSLKDFTLADAFKLPDIIASMGGVFLESFNIELVSNDVEGLGSYKKVDDTWKIHDNRETGKEEIYGQLYILPQAKLLKASELASQLDIDLPDRAMDLEFPLIHGPSFPLFDMTREHRAKTGYTVEQEQYNRFNAYYKNPDAHSYVVFANMWDVDGNTAFDVADCLAKGNALGLDEITISSNQPVLLDKCGYAHDDLFISISQHNSVVEDTDSPDQLPFELTGTFYFWGKDRNGGSYEPYGYFNLELGTTRTEEIWEAGKGDMSLKNYDHYTEDFAFILPHPGNKITLRGYVKEHDTFGDDSIGNFDNTNIEPTDIFGASKDFVFTGKSGAVTISLKLQQGNGPEELVEYELFGVFHFTGTDGEETEYEPTGDFSVQILHRAINANFHIWHSDVWGVSVKNHHSYTQPFRIRFREKEGFSKSTDPAIILHGSVYDVDTSSGNDGIGNYEGTKFSPSDLTNSPTTSTFEGKSGSVQISLGLIRIGKAGEESSSSNAEYEGYEAENSMPSKTEYKAGEENSKKAKHAEL